ncbi:MAG TPA: UDP-N-acetylmuramoyl-L-alanine--D-glutamate ligase [Patescibacteria group bacterium]|jgi:UDP-N-acetylmuramoylalanine--D-glutamate ligase|nr:UDP-N-acetylmuramoyl-L-alanine--D-glutamate ligase [Patescibacteria group bacterium]
MELTDLQSKNIAILGFGQEGQAVFSYLTKHGITATVLDKEQQGESYLNNLTEFDIIFRSPGIWRNTPQILEAEKQGKVITSQAKWFFENSPAKIIGITGTKGKGTTSSLIYNILKASGKSAYLTGNIGKTQPLEILDELSDQAFVVYELSSFQLQDLTISPHIGVCLMVTSDHLNHHTDLDEYHSAKSSITAFQTAEDFAIYNIDYEASKAIGEKGDGAKLQISAQTKPAAGAYIDAKANAIEIYQPSAASFTIDCSERKLRGNHNLENIAAAVLTSLNLGISKEVISEQIKSFAGLEHRLEFIGTFGEVSYYNDSISTVPETTIAAVKSFSEPIHLFLGGSDKGLHYDGLIAELLKQQNIASITLLGETGLTIKSELEKQNSSIPTFGPYTDFDLAITQTIARTKAGDIVLLSPASASFDMFNNYAERGHKFVELVKQKTSHA